MIPGSGLTQSLSVESLPRRSLEAASSQLERMLGRISEGISSLDAGFRFVYINDRASALFRRKREEILGKHLLELFPELAGGDFHRAMVEAYMKQEPVKLERLSDLHERWFAYSFFPSPEGITILTQDIHERKTGDERLRRLQAVSAALSHALVPRDVIQAIVYRGASALGALAGTVSLLNAAGTQFRIAESVGFTDELLEAYQGWYPVDGATPIAVAIRARAPVYVRWEEISAPSHPSVFLRLVQEGHSSYAAIPLSFNGRIQGALALTFSHRRQFTEEEQAFLVTLAEQCGQAFERASLFQGLQEAIRARDEFLSIASHELMTPLTSLKLQSQMTRRLIEAGQPEAVSPERIRKLMITTDDQVNRITRLVDDMLDLTRISAGKFSIHIYPTDLSRLARELCERFEAQFRAVGCQLTTEIAPGVVGNWDRVRIEQVLSNLCTNAIKYGRGKPVTVKVWGEEGRALFSVRDNGIGIAPESQERIFNRFERAISSSEVSGLGLGLYIVRSIVEAHGGGIRLESMPGKGSCFTVTLPLSPER